MKRFRLTPSRIVLLLVLTVAGSVGVGYATSLPVSSTSLGAASQTLTKGTCTLSASQSTVTYVDASRPTTNQGSTSLLVQPDTATRKITFVQFSLSSCSLPTTAGADTATLQLYVSTAPAQNRTLAVIPVTSSWSGTLTWNQAQSLTTGSQTTTLATGTTSGAFVSATVTVDVDALIKSPNSSFGWEIVDNGTAAANDTTTFQGNTGSQSKRPTLTISYEK